MQENSKTEEANNIKEGQKESNTESLNQNLDNHKTEILQKSELLTKPPELWIISKKIYLFLIKMI